MLIFRFLPPAQEGEKQPLQSFEQKGSTDFFQVLDTDSALLWRKVAAVLASFRRLGVNLYRYNHYQWPPLPYDTHYQWQSLPDDNHYHWQPLPATTTRFYWTRKPLPATTTTWQQLPYDDHWVCIFANFSNKSFKSKTTCMRIYLLVDTWRFIRGGPVL